MSARLSRLGALALLAAGTASACSPIVVNRGYAPTDGQIAELLPGIDDANTVSAKIGRPSIGGVVRNDSWYYVASRVETFAYNAPEVTERKVVAVQFDPQGVVQSVNIYGVEDGRIINYVTRTTPTFGRELTVLQQIFGNLTNIGASTVESTRSQ